MFASFDMRTGELVWRRSLSAAEPPHRITAGISHGLLSLRDGTLYYNTNLGAVAAIAARTVTDYVRLTTLSAGLRTKQKIRTKTDWSLFNVILTRACCIKIWS